MISATRKVVCTFHLLIGYQIHTIESKGWGDTILECVLVVIMYFIHLSYDNYEHRKANGITNLILLVLE